MKSITVIRWSCLLLSAFLTASLGVISVVQAQVLNEDLKLIARNGDDGDEFGRAIAVENGVIAVGTYRNEFNDTRPGIAYLFDSAGVEYAKLIANDFTPGDRLGYALDIDNGIVAVGAFLALNEDDVATGAVYLFDATSGQQIGKVLASDGEEYDFFGYSVSLDNGILVAGSRGDDDLGYQSGSAYTFDISTGKELTKMYADNADAFSYFGGAVTIKDGVVGVGAIFHDTPGFGYGAAYLFNAHTGELFTHIIPQGVNAFGASVAVGDGVFAVGAHHDEFNGESSGSVFLYDLTTYQLIARLSPKDSAESNYFGWRISIDGDLIAIAAPGFEENTGAAYLFRISTGEQLAKFIASDGEIEHQLGSSIDIHQGEVVVGAQYDDGLGEDTGAAYLFDISCQADLNLDFILDMRDVSAFQAAFVAHDPVADFVPDGNFDFFDVSAFLNAFIEGCL